MTAARILKHCGAERNGLGFWECDAAHCPFPILTPPSQWDCHPDDCDYPLPEKSDAQEQREDDARERARDMRSVK